MAVKPKKKWHQNYLLRRQVMLAGDHIVKTRHVKQGTQGMLAREHLSPQSTLTHEYITTQGMLTREARKLSRHIDT